VRRIRRECGHHGSGGALGWLRTAWVLRARLSVRAVRDEALRSSPSAGDGLFLTLSLPCPPVASPALTEREVAILRQTWPEICAEALDFKLKGMRSGRILLELKVHRGVVVGASTSRTMEVK
jgi:hypothetical protein